MSRAGVESYANGMQAGGLSGAPLRERSTRVLRILSRELKDEIPLIGVGGILSGADAVEKLDAGASLVQIYTGLIYRGPALVTECVSACLARGRVKRNAPSPWSTKRAASAARAASTPARWTRSPARRASCTP